MKKKIHFIILFLLGLTAVNAQTSANEQRARDYIKSQEKELQIKPEHSFSLRFVRKGLAGETLRFQQMLNNVPVFQSEIVVNFDLEDKVAYSSNNYDTTVDNINTNPSISEQQAIAISNASLNDTNGKIAFQACKLYIYNLEKPTRLVYRVSTQIDNKPGDWQVFVDANTSKIIKTENIALDFHATNVTKEKKRKEKKEVKESKAPLAFTTGTGMIFNPDPLSAAHATYAGGYLDNNDADSPQLQAARTAVVLPQIDLTAGVYRLKSQYLNIADFEAPNLGLFTQATNAFNFTRDNDAFEAVNAFYHLDNSMRYINSTLGIVCLPNNATLFQFDPSGLSGADNSHFLPSTDQIAFGEGSIDDAEDADVVLHEFGHGIHDWLTGGGGSQVTGLGEGNGDYWAQSYSRSLSQWTSVEANYNKVFTWDGNDSWSGRSTGVTATYPQTGATNTEIHTYGQIWATALMKIWDVLGRTKTDKAFLEGLALTNNSTNQPNAAIAVRQAAINMNYPCADILTMTQKFTAAGYTMPAVALKINCPGTQTVTAGAGNTYTVPSYSSLTNAISPLCNAVVTQSPAIGSSLAPGTYTVTMTATNGTAVNCPFTLIVQPLLGLDEVIKNNLKVYPNPASTNITIKGDFISDQNITVYNILGQKVMEKTLKNNENILDISSLALGVYTIRFNETKTTIKFVKN
ncbi:T9SS type A sorting domain-containing protein [Flavobacterium sp.]|uniref:T9SS type A sorting domain-containing protein n=1 Tax=Flavobacterium sp. TaxID=239 RepID=UPI0038FBEACA